MIRSGTGKPPEVQQTCLKKCHKSARFCKCLEPIKILSSLYQNGPVPQKKVFATKLFLNEPTLIRSKIVFVYVGCKVNVSQQCYDIVEKVNKYWDV